MESCVTALLTSLCTCMLKTIDLCCLTSGSELAVRPYV